MKHHILSLAESILVVTACAAWLDGQDAIGNAVIAYTWVLISLSAFVLVMDAISGGEVMRKHRQENPKPMPKIVTAVTTSAAIVRIITIAVQGWIVTSIIAGVIFAMIIAAKEKANG